VVKISQWSV